MHDVVRGLQTTFHPRKTFFESKHDIVSGLYSGLFL